MSAADVSRSKTAFRLRLTTLGCEYRDRQEEHQFEIAARRSIPRRTRLVVGGAIGALIATFVLTLTQLSRHMIGLAVVLTVALLAAQFLAINVAIGNPSQLTRNSTLITAFILVYLAPHRFVIMAGGAVVATVVVGFDPRAFGFDVVLAIVIGVAMQYAAQGNYAARFRNYAQSRIERFAEIHGREDEARLRELDRQREFVRVLPVGVLAVDGAGMVEASNSRFDDLFELAPHVIRPGRAANDFADEMKTLGWLGAVDGPAEAILLPEPGATVTIDLADDHTIEVRCDRLSGGGRIAAYFERRTAE
ncbi:MAG: hypothetical protein EXQ85_02615 [Alphaproteobacteria bacterium]|nr:hypothetical protein [Alphaproteobacteria bacterium]